MANNMESSWTGGAGTSGPNLVVDPYCVSAGEICTGKSIVKRVLVGRENYVTWRKAMELALSGRSQLGFVRGEYSRPEDPVMLARWQRCNDIVMSWIISSVSEGIGEHVMRCKDVMAAWESLKVRYGGTNLARKSVLITEISNCVQGDSDVGTYFDKLSKYWEDLDSIKKIRSCTVLDHCACCQETENEVREERVVRFLIGLNDSFGVVRSNIFAKDEVPNIDKVYEIISQEEAQRNAKRGVSNEASALYGAGINNNNNYGVQGRINNNAKAGNGAGRGKPKIQCSYCKMLGHTKEYCYKLIGYPSGWKRDETRGGKYFNANNVSVNNDAIVSSEKSGSPFSSEQMEQVSQLLSFFKSGNVLSASSNQMAGIVHSAAFVREGECWMIDSGATCHFAKNADLLKDISPLKYKCIVKLPNGVSIPVRASGVCYLNRNLVLRDVLLVPEFTVNLISVSKLLSDNECEVKFTRSGCIVQDRLHKNMLRTDTPEEGLFITRMIPQVQACSVNSVSKDVVRNKSVNELELWHSRLGHASINVVSDFLRGYNKAVPNKSIDCMICPQAKQSRLPFFLSNHVSSELFELVHGDVWGPFHVETMGSYKYFLTLVDDLSRATWVYLMHTKSEVITHVKNFVKMIDTQFKGKIKTLRTDNGGEFINHQIEEFLQSIGCLQQSSCPYTPQQNGIAERKHRHLLEITRALLLQAGLPKCFWGDGVLTATHIINRLPSKVLKGKTPWEMLFQKSAPIDHLRVFGC